MSLLFVIDGYNITNHRLFPRERNKTKNSPAALIYLIKTKKLCGSPKNQAEVVFDGFRPVDFSLSGQDNQVKVIFSQEISADERIKQIIEGMHNKKNAVVVSEDKEIVYFAKISGVKALSVESFLEPLLGEESRKGSGLKLDKDAKDELNFSQRSRIDEELRRRWLK